MLPSSLLTEPPTLPAPPSSDARLAPRRVGAYPITGRLGSGSMGTVYQARSDELGREVAIKVCSDPAGPQGPRFLREARALATVGHPNVPFVFEHGEDDSGRPYVVLEYLRGANLHQLVHHDGPQPVTRVVHVLKQLAAALWAVHARGLVHRDVKPSNVLLTRQEGCDDLVKLVDFGLVLDLFAAEICDAGPCGTPGYIAPEALEPGAIVDGRADIYAAGAVGHFLLLGEHVDKAPDGLATLAADSRDPALRTLVSLLQRCLATGPDARPCDARALFVELRDLANVAPWHPELAEQWWTDYIGVWGVEPDEGTLVEAPAWLWC